MSMNLVAMFNGDFSGSGEKSRKQNIDAIRDILNKDDVIIQMPETNDLELLSKEDDVLSGEIGQEKELGDKVIINFDNVQSSENKNSLIKVGQTRKSGFINSEIINNVQNSETKNRKITKNFKLAFNEKEELNEDYSDEDIERLCDKYVLILRKKSLLRANANGVIDNDLRDYCKMILFSNIKAKKELVALLSLQNEKSLSDKENKEYKDSLRDKEGLESKEGLCDKEDLSLESLEKGENFSDNSNKFLHERTKTKSGGLFTNFNANLGNNLQNGMQDSFDKLTDYFLEFLVKDNKNKKEEVKSANKEVDSAKKEVKDAKETIEEKEALLSSKKEEVKKEKKKNKCLTTTLAIVAVFAPFVVPVVNAIVSSGVSAGVQVGLTAFINSLGNSSSPLI